MLSRRIMKKLFGFIQEKIVNVSKDFLIIISRLFCFCSMFCFSCIYYIYKSKGRPVFIFYPSSSWSPGSWGHGIPHSLTWTQTELRPKYTWEEAISLVEMESWVQDAVESFFIYAMKSQLVCEGNYVSSSLTTLVCDCVDSGGLLFCFVFCFLFLFVCLFVYLFISHSFIPTENCYLADIETEVGVSAACAQTSSVLKGPSSHTTFGEYSINDLCTEVYIFF